MFRPILLSLVLWASCVQRHSDFNDEITVPELKHHIEFLASDRLKGRASGSDENNIAAHYLEEELRSFGVEPKGEYGKYLQEFEVVTALKPGNSALSANEKPFQLDSSFRPMAFSKDTTVEGELLLTGYGISAPDLEYDDFKNLDVKGKIILVLRGSPDGDSPHSKFSSHAPLRRKAAVAVEKGAKGILFVAATDDEDDLIPLKYEYTLSRYEIPAISITRKAALAMTGMTNDQLLDYQKQLDERKNPLAKVAASIKIQSQVIVERKNTANVIGWIEGSDQNLKNEFVVIGAHFDHLGMGGEGSLYKGAPAIHNGADDNASGTAAILELAQKLASVKSKLKRSILVIGFSGEEMGLLGSKYFVEHPTIDLKSITTMLNFDMVGRLKENQLIIQGMGTAPGFRDLVNKANGTSQLALQLQDDGNGPSDFATFYQKDIPVISYFTNLHEDYHKPTDDADKINYEGEEKIARMAFDVIMDLSTEEHRPVFTKVKGDSTKSPMGFRVSLGIIPNYADNSEGLKVDGVNPGGAGEKAGLQKGDIIVKMGSRAIKNIYDYTYALGELKAGDKVEVIVKRDGKEIKLTALMQKSKRTN